MVLLLSNLQLRDSKKVLSLKIFDINLLFKIKKMADNELILKNKSAVTGLNLS